MRTTRSKKERKNINTGKEAGLMYPLLTSLRKSWLARVLFTRAVSRRMGISELLKEQWRAIANQAEIAGKMLEPKKIITPQAGTSIKKTQRLA